MNYVGQPITEQNSGSNFLIGWFGLSFKSRDKKLEIFLPKNQHAKGKLMNFENWVNEEVSKIEHHFRK